MQIKPGLDADGFLEAIIARGITPGDAKSAADFRRFTCKRLPKWLLASAMSMVGQHAHVATKAEVWRLVIKAGCQRVERNKDLGKLRQRNLLAGRSSVGQRSVEKMLGRRRFEWHREETYNTAEDWVYCVDRDRDRLESYCDQLHLDPSDAVTLVCVLGFAAGQSMNHGGMVPEFAFEIAVDENDAFQTWLNRQVYGAQ